MKTGNLRPKIKCTLLALMTIQFLQNKKIHTRNPSHNIYLELSTFASRHTAERTIDSPRFGFICQC